MPFLLLSANGAYDSLAGRAPVPGDPVETLMYARNRFHLDITDHSGHADALYAEWAALDGLDGRFREPFDTPYGLREFVYIDPDGTAHRVGSPLDR